MMLSLCCRLNIIPCFLPRSCAIRAAETAPYPDPNQTSCLVDGKGQLLLKQVCRGIGVQGGKQSSRGEYVVGVHAQHRVLGCQRAGAAAREGGGEDLQAILPVRKDPTGTDHLRDLA